MNVISLMGRLTRDPEIKFGQSGKAYCRFSIAVNRPFSKDEADFINWVSFGKTAELIGEYFRKGKQIALVGRLQMNQYEDRKSTRLNSSHANISYAVFCLKTKEIRRVNGIG